MAGTGWPDNAAAALAALALLTAFFANLEATATAASCWQVEDAVENRLPSEACFCRTRCRLALLVACCSC